MEDGRGQHGVGTGLDRGREVLDRAGTARGDDRDRHLAAYRADQLEVEAVLGAVGVHGVEQDLAGTELGAARGPRDRVEARPGCRPPWVVTSKPESVPGARRASTDSTSTWLPNRSAISATSSGRADRGGVHRDLVGAGPQQPVDVVDRADTRRRRSAG